MGARGGWTVVVGFAIVVGVIAWGLLRDGTQPHAKGLDIQAFRTEQAARLQRAKSIAARPARAANASAPSGPGSSTSPAAGSSAGAARWPMQGRGPTPNLGRNLLTPCVLGPGELCATLADLVDGCDAGDADDCLAIGQFLADAPPRPLIAHVFFTQACRVGDARGCERLDQLKPPSTMPCDQDPFACAWQGYRSRDPAVLDQACTLGAADACGMMAELTKTDIARSRTYLERACQLGNPMTCEELGRRLSPGCVASQETTCYPADPAQAEAALAMACGAGIQTACK